MPAETMDFFDDSGGPPLDTVLCVSQLQEVEADQLLSEVYKIDSFASEVVDNGAIFEQVEPSYSIDFLSSSTPGEVQNSFVKTECLSACTESLENSFDSSAGQSSAGKGSQASIVIPGQVAHPSILGIFPKRNDSMPLLFESHSRCSFEESFEDSQPDTAQAKQKDQSRESLVSQYTHTLPCYERIAQESPRNDVVDNNAALLPTPFREADGLFCCIFCDMRFKQTGNRKKHIEETHMRRKPFTCSVCHVSFSRKHARDTHQRAVHEQLRPYSCPYCFKLYKNRSDLNKHIRTVEKREKPFLCDTCGRGFGERGKLRRHTAIHAKSRRLVLIGQDT